MTDSLLIVIALTGGISTTVIGCLTSYLYYKAKKEEVVMKMIIELHREAYSHADLLHKDFYDDRIKFFVELAAKLRS